MDEQDNSGQPAGRRGKRREQTPVQRALGLLVRREHSQRELTRKLTQRGIEPEQAEQAVARLAEAGWQDNERFAHSLVRSRANSGYGPLHIRAELGMHQLGSDLVADAMDAYEGDWEQNARDLVRRRSGSGAPDMARLRKLADMLARRGFPAEIIRRVCTGAGQDWDDQA